MAFSCTSFHDSRLLTLRSLVSAAVFSVLVVGLACVILITGSRSAMAAGASHEHSMHRSTAVQSNVIASAAMSAVVMDVAADAETADCNGHSGHKTGSASKKCCASMCCATDMVSNCDYSHVSGNQVNSIWLFVAQFVVLKHASGLDRPPDFRA